MTEIQAQSKKERAKLRVWVKLADKWGLIDGNEKWIVEPSYDDCKSVINDLAVVTFSKDSEKEKKSPRKHAVVNDQGKVILEFEVIDAKFAETFETIIFETETGMGCMNLKGEVLVEPVYEAVREDHSDEQRFFVKKEGKWGLFDIKIKILIAPVYDWMSTLHTNRYIAVKGGKSGVVNDKNDVLVDFDYKSTLAVLNIEDNGQTTVFNEFWALKDGKTNLINSGSGEVILTDNELLPIHSMGELRPIPFINGENKGYVNELAESVLSVSSSYVFLNYFSEGKAVFAKYVEESIPEAPFKNRAYGVINKDGKEIIKPIYGWMASFKYERAACQLGGKYGFIDENGDVKVDIKYDDALFYDHNGIAEVKLDNKVGYVDKEGKEVIPLQFSYIKPFNNYYLCKGSNLYTVMDCKGNVILSGQYDRVKVFKKDSFIYK